ncbi:MAG: hypothetical protein HY840_07375 [Bacteroidetes bacterium]|nr:hypothetical protein [Bacteroidota bacterium]
MKKTSTSIFDLIHSLSMAEKKYFKMLSSLKGGDKNYLVLYDVIEKQNRYDEGAIRNTCRGQKFLRHLSVAKRRLHNSILRSLENYHNSTDINLRSQISKAGILLDKGLTDQALKLLRAAKSIAYQHEHWELLMEILIMERIPYSAQELLKMSHLNEEIKTVLKKLNNIDDYRTLHYKITRKIHEAEPMRTKKEQVFITKLMRHPLLRNLKQASCAEAKATYYEVWSLYYFFKRDFIRGYELSKEQCKFIETHSHQLRDYGKRYLFGLNMSVIFIGYLLSVNHNLYEEMQILLNKIRAYPIASHSLKISYWSNSYINELNAFMRTGDFEKVFPVIKAIEANNDFLNKDPAVSPIILYYNIAYMLFGAGSYNKALFWTQKIVEQPEGAFRHDVYAAARILFLLIHYEIHKDAQLLKSLQRSTLYLLSKQNRLFKLEKALMNCLHQVMKVSIDKHERILAFHVLKTTLLKLMKDPLEKVAMEEFDFLSWVESKIQHKTFEDVVKEKSKQLFRISRGALKKV